MIRNATDLHAPTSPSPNPAVVADAGIPALDDCALLLDIDGTLLELAPTPSEVWVPPELRQTIKGLLARTSGALALVSGRSIVDIDAIFAPSQFPAVGGHGAEMRLSAGGAVTPSPIRPIEPDLKRRFAAIAGLAPGILLEDKGYSLALHYRLAPQAERGIYQAVSEIRAELPGAPIEVLPGKSVCEIKPAGFSKASGVRKLMENAPFKGRTPVFLGDDVTDETVFAIMPDLRGLAFSVGRHASGVAGHFDDPRQVRAWLEGLLVREGMIAR
ncbi:trehalose-phosphatase [Bradyrhizobium sp. U87765 SZCCT0131]|uniref:trehalose-phosphatase n=1 Tax=unclassified Bradyrhizobium TaxID=2631580 RepID=UPI001BA7589C|nr:MULTISPECIES: trehalose-phosphatase [unclassified Bradyrhizobium]MBR1217487.1 trehalose-phosphatase [Bradyrhizobium sp. U87765 SZCCT0131]MBR1264916.1 trehalose-phosphatase [Bradyrhizobium sp. U87765 SZCCT0134]MBR1304898.1 trehalose-phosphatase [Bradyrhizobium sp. U87765 SZCCT0110]MBR1320684.1 trehalose-phosphatase [Bradyrhizobium sp. U87765 SZCCT0109]MBR1349104.1 trehalose-phosphatase [Bradyrhizobium sp. U87765 SZCCT0048]